jgi:hypothetical protein
MKPNKTRHAFSQGSEKGGRARLFKTMNHLLFGQKTEASTPLSWSCSLPSVRYDRLGGMGSNRVLTVRMCHSMCCTTPCNSFTNISVSGRASSVACVFLLHKSHCVHSVRKC